MVPQGLLREHSVRITPRLTSATLWDETRFGRRENLLRLKRVTLNDKAWGNSQDTPLPREKEEAEPLRYKRQHVPRPHCRDVCRALVLNEQPLADIVSYTLITGTFMTVCPA